MLGPPVAAATHLMYDLRLAGWAHVPRSGPALLVANHTDHLDPIVLLVAARRRGRRVRFLALDELFDLPLTGWWLRREGAIPVSRGRGAEPMVQRVGAALAAGELVAVYPEGRLPRHPGDRPAARRGVGALARSLPDDVPIVPVAHHGLEPTADRRGHPAVRTLRRGLRHPVGVVAGSPLAASDLGDDDGGAAAALLGVIRARLEPLAAALSDAPARHPRG